MKVLHIGMGEWGIGWFNALKDRSDIEIVGVVDLEESKRVEGFEFYTDAARAMDELQPDFILNSTPPAAHQEINRLSIARDIPILCEKPIAKNYVEARELLEFALRGHKIMIAENYRYLAVNRQVKNALAGCSIGKISSINIKFDKSHRMNNYHAKLEHPLLMDVTIHHFDLLRYFTSAEVAKISADFFTPEWSWYEGYSNVVTTMHMADGTVVNYQGSLDSHSETSWNGTWEFVGEHGTLSYSKDWLYIINDDDFEKPWQLDEDASNDKDLILDEFIAYLQGGPMPETHIIDNIKTFKVALAAVESFEKRCEVKVDAD